MPCRTLSQHVEEQGVVNRPASSPLRHAVVGIGASIFKYHLPGLRLESSELAAGSDVSEERGRPNADEAGCTFYADHRAMLAEIKPDVVVIMTPHPAHAPIAIECLEAGCHVLVEKPMAVQVAEADAMIAAAAGAKRVLAVSFQQRFRPEVRAARELIQQGRLGAVQHVNITSMWTRTAAYYKSDAWRARWAGEGAGVLLNQAPHDLDLLCHLLGPPATVVAWTRTRLHAIETEDTVQAMLEWPGGALGSLHVSTAECGQPQRLEIVGTGGALQIGDGEITFEQAEVDMREFLAQCPDGFGEPARRTVAIELGPPGGEHCDVYRDLHEAIADDRPPMADGIEGRMSLELANAMIYSSYVHEEVTLPLDRAKYAAVLEALQAGTR